MNMSKKSVTTEMILEAAKFNPQGFLDIDLANPRSSKNSANLYHDVKIIMPDGTKKKLGVSWNNIPLAGGIKKPEERKYDPTLIYRRSSGNLGESIYLTYKEYERIIDTGKAAGNIKLKKGKDTFRTALQEDLEDGTVLDEPMIRFKLPFHKDTNRPMFKVVKIEEGPDGNYKQVNVKVTKDNIHEIIRSRSITAGYARMDTVVFSNFGISMPAKVELLVIKPPEDDTPDVEDILDPEMMAAMVTKPMDNDEVVGEEKDNGDSEKPQDDDTSAQIAELQALAEAAEAEE